MSSDIYIPLGIVISHPKHFRLTTDYNVDLETAASAINEPEPDWDWIKDCLKPVLMCQFWPRISSRHVEVFTNVIDGRQEPVLHVKCNGDFLKWLCDWLHAHNYPYTII